MSEAVASRRPALLLLVCALAIAAPPSDLSWLAVSSALWLLALPAPTEIRWRPAMAGWWLWIAWYGLCAVFSDQPWMSLRACGRWAGAGAVLMLAGSWWGMRERRWWGYGAWIAALLGLLLRAPGRFESLYGRVLAETGWVGLFLFLWAFYQCIPRGFRRLDGATRSAALLYLTLGAFFLFNDMPASPGLLLLWWSAASLIDAAGRHGAARASDWQEPALLPRWVPPLGLGLAALSWAPAALLSRSLRAAEEAASPLRRVECLRLAAAIAPREAFIQERLARAVLNGSPPRPGEALRRIRLAAEAAPREPGYRRQEAELLAAFGERR